MHIAGWVFVGQLIECKGMVLEFLYDDGDQPLHLLHLARRNYVLASRQTPERA
jgi:hypothetical protein